MFNWKKLGNVFNPTLTRPQPWIQEFAQCPTPFILNDRVLRVYVACRPQRGSDLQYLSYPGYVDLDRQDLTRVLGVSERPLMPLSQPGAFDEFGIMPSSFVRRGDDIYAYYTGWTRMQSVPYTLAIGVAVSRDGGTCFEKVGEGPVLGLSLHEPYFVTGPVVRATGDDWTMWYLSGRKWLEAEGKLEPVYQVARASSRDGLHWVHDGTPILPTLAPDECQDILAPFQLGGRWHAVFAHRKPSSSEGAYRLGYASSDDLLRWRRDDAQVGLELSPQGWDSQMICYPQTIELDGRILMFYCGNDFGREGFGIAELVGHEP